LGRTPSDAAVGAFVYRLAPSFGGSYARFTRERNGAHAALVMAEEQTLVQALHLDSDQLIDAVMAGEGPREAADLTGVDIKADMEELEPVIKLAWYGWLRDGGYTEHWDDLTEEEQAASFSDSDDAVDQDTLENLKDELEDLEEKEGNTNHLGTTTPGQR